MTDSPDSHDQDLAAFKQAMADVNQDRRAYRNRKVVKPQKPDVAKIGFHKPTHEDSPGTSAVMLDKTDQGESVLFVRSGLQNKLVKRLQRGELGWQDELDLHGMRANQARQQLTEFLQNSISNRFNNLLIVHGKGLRSGEPGGVLKPLTIDYLKRHSHVLAFCSTLPKHGDTGAVYVLLKSNRMKNG